MGGHHADGRGPFLFNQGQGRFRGKFFQHHGFSPGNGSGKIGQGSGCTAGMGGNGHGDVILCQAPDIHPALGGADAGGGRPFHQLGNTGGARGGGEDGHVFNGIQPSFCQDLLVNGQPDPFFHHGRQGKGPGRCSRRNQVVKQKNIL